MSNTVSKRSGLVRRKRLPHLQDLHQHRGLHIFAQRLLEPQFLRPFDVVAHVGGVDARARNLQLVENLYRLQLDDARAAQPGEGDILRQLTVRTRGRTKRRRRAMPVKFHRKIQPGDAAEEFVGRQVEDFAFPLILEKGAPQQQRQRNRYQFSHCRASPSPYKSAGTPRTTAPRPPGGGSARARSPSAPLPLPRGRSRSSAHPSIPSKPRRWC